MANKTNYYRPESRENDARHTDSHAGASRTLDEISSLPLGPKRDAIRQILIGIDVDVSKNDADQYGDGDQSRITVIEHRDIARHLFALGGDIYEHHHQPGAMTEFSLACSAGIIHSARRIISGVLKGESQPYSRSAALHALLENRETSMRLSPLLLVVAMGKNLQTPFQPDAVLHHRDVAKLLLKHGASPVAKDLVGKTVCHYGAGAMGTRMTMDVVDMCIRAAKSHHLFGKEVILHRLKNEEMNGKVGIAGGFDADSDRRSVYLPSEEREVWIKIENMKSVDESISPHQPLVDTQDRLGTVSLHELIMGGSFTGITKPPDWPAQHETASFLLEKHNASVDIEDMDGVSPVRMASGMGQMIGERGVGKLIMDKARLDAAERTRKNKNACWNCRTEISRDLANSLCAKCKVAQYCGRSCQVAHWKQHKRECKNLIARSLGIKLDAPDVMEEKLHCTTTNFQTGTVYAGGSYRKPDDVDFGNKFVVKVQGGGDAQPLMVYDQTRTCMFSIKPEHRGFQDILTEVRNEPAWRGRKTYMKASFDRSGCCTMYPEKAGVKWKYAW